ncbi:MAG: SWIM zinc finger family protein [Vicinamibacteraceae bacterium]
MDYDGWRRYVPVAARRRQAMRALAGLEKQGRAASPVVIDGRRITSTFWGKAWCENLERYSDFSNRLPRGRTYVRNGSVIDLQVARGAVTSLVSGSDIYEVRIGVAAVPQARWRGICRDCTGAIDSVVELLQGRLSTSVMARICEPRTGLFPAPKEISLRCSCPDWARMCKHVAAVLYGIGARLDERPELLFLLRGVNEQDLIARADTGLQPGGRKPAPAKILDTGDLSEIFGIEIATSEPPQAPRGRRKRTGSAAASPAPPTGQPDPKPAARASHTPHRPARAASRSRG